MNCELSIDEIHTISLEILKKIIEICDSEGINYWLTYGTLIGAIRHKGFIPWDDDVDIAMERIDYDKFIKYCLAHETDLKPFKLFSFETCKEFFYPIARFSDTRYRLVDEYGSENSGLGLFVDVYPFDNCIPGDSKFFKKRKKLLRSILLNYKCNIKLQSQSIIKLYCKKIYRFFTKVFKIDPEKRKLRLKKFIKKYSDLNKNSDYIDCITWTFSFNKRIKKEWFSNFIDVDFNGIKCKAPICYHDFLTACYDDYMKMPDESQRIQQHNYRAYKLK